MEIYWRKYFKMDTTFYIRSKGLTILPYLCVDKNLCSKKWGINGGWIIFGFHIVLNADE